MKATEYFLNINECFRLCKSWVETSLDSDNGMIPIVCGNEKPYHDRVTELFNKIDAVDANDIINELAQCKKSMIRVVCAPLFGFTSHFDDTIGITDHRPSIEAYNRIKSLKKTIAMKVISVYGFRDLDDLFSVPQHLRAQYDNDRFQLNQKITNDLYNWAKDEKLLDGESIEDFVEMIKMADFSLMWNRNKSHAKVDSLIFALYNHKFFGDNDGWLAAVLRSINAVSFDNVSKNKKPIFDEKIEKALCFVSEK